MKALRLVALVALVLFGAFLLLVIVLDSEAGDDDAIVVTPDSTPAEVATPEATPVPEPTAEPTPEPITVPPVDLATVGQPWSDTVTGMLTFRGNPTRTFYGTGPVPEAPVVRWAYGADTMCETNVAEEVVEPRCGTTWPGQAIVIDDDAGPVVVFGGFDGSIRTVDAVSGLDARAPFPTEDTVAGAVTADPDGFPLLYAGSHDSGFRVLATDREEIVELWELDSFLVEPGNLSDDWDGAAILLGDLLVVGGTNGQLHVVSLGREIGDDGLVTVAPELVFHTETSDDPTEDFAIESSVAVSGQTAWLANSAGTIQGWDLSPLERNEAPVQVFEFVFGDDADATVVVDESGDLYVGQLFVREQEPALSLGHVARLDPDRPDDPLVWSVSVGEGQFSGVRATPALHGDALYTATNDGRLLGLDRATGEIRWEKQLAGPTWASPVVVDDVLIQVDCAGFVRAYDVSDTAIDPPLLWSSEVGGCLESTPVVWDGVVYVGSRDGRVFALADN